MTIQEREKIVKLISSGKNTYADLKTALPHYDNDFFRINSFSLPYECRIIKPLVYISHNDSLVYQFLDSDKFELTTSGKDLLYQLKKETEQKRLNQKIYAATLVGLLISAIGVLLSLVR